MPSKPPVGTGGIGFADTERSVPWWVIALVGAFIGMTGHFLFLGTQDASDSSEEKRVFMSQCVVVKEQREQRCDELWRHRLNK